MMRILITIVVLVVAMAAPAAAVSDAFLELVSVGCTIVDGPEGIIQKMESNYAIPFCKGVEEVQNGRYGNLTFERLGIVGGGAYKFNQTWQNVCVAGNQFNNKLGRDDTLRLFGVISDSLTLMYGDETDNARIERVFNSVKMWKNKRGLSFTALPELSIVAAESGHKNLPMQKLATAIINKDSAAVRKILDSGARTANLAIGFCLDKTDFTAPRLEEPPPEKSSAKSSPKSKKKSEKPDKPVTSEKVEKPVIKDKYSKTPSFTDSWNIKRNENNQASFMSGSVDLTFIDDAVTLSDVNGLPDFRPFIADSFKMFNKKFGTNIKPIGKDETITLLRFITQMYEFDRDAWDFCKSDQNIPTLKRNCDMTPYADAASVVVARFNEGSLQPLINTYSFINHFMKNQSSFKKNKDFIDFVKWSSYGEYGLFLYTGKGSVPSDMSVYGALDFINYLEWAAVNPKVKRNALINKDNMTVENADDPKMYKNALSFLSTLYDKSKKTLSIAKSNNDIVDLFSKNAEAAKVKLVASKLQKEFNISENAALDMAVHVIFSITGDIWQYKFTKAPRVVTYSMKSEIVKNEDDAFKKLYNDIYTGGRMILGTDVYMWIDELSAKAGKK